MAALRRETVDEFQARYRLGKRLGHGQFGFVQQAEVIATGELVAVKIIENGKMIPEQLQSELHCHAQLDHNHVLHLIEAVDLDDCVAMVLELASGGDLFDFIVPHTRGLPEDTARPLFKQLLQALSYCHSKRVAHRDLKPENILLKDGQVKLADFGLAVQFDPDVPLTDSVGSPNYAAPELLKRGGTHDGRQVDAWAAGVVLFAMLAGRLPFDRDVLQDLFRDISCGRYEIPGFFSPEAGDLIRRLLTLDASRRMTVDEALAHDWVLGQRTAAGAEPLAPPPALPAAADAPHLDPSTTLPFLLLDGIDEEGEEGERQVSTADVAGAGGKPDSFTPATTPVKLLKSMSVLLLSRGSARPRSRAPLRRRILSAMETRRCSAHLPPVPAVAA